MRVVIQGRVRGVFETLWSSQIVDRYGRLRTKKVREAQCLAVQLMDTCPAMDFQVGVSDGKAAGLNLVSGSQLLPEVRRALRFASHGCQTVK